MHAYMGSQLNMGAVVMEAAEKMYVVWSPNGKEVGAEVFIAELTEAPSPRSMGALQISLPNLEG